MLNIKLLSLTTLIFILTSCIQSTDKSGQSGISGGGDSPSVSSTSKKVFKTYDFKRDSLGRRVIALTGQQEQLDLSEAIEFCNGKDVQSFKVVRSNGMMELETTGGVPHINVIGAAAKFSPYKIVITMTNGESKTFNL